MFFEGASEDGKLVYFTSTQKLTNDAVDGTASGEAYEGGYESKVGFLSKQKMLSGRGEMGSNLYEFNLDVPVGEECRWSMSWRGCGGAGCGGDC